MNSPRTPQFEKHYLAETRVKPAFSMNSGRYLAYTASVTGCTKGIMPKIILSANNKKF
jgi:hypothetical protein